MSDHQTIPHRLDAAGNKIPRIAIMGEFSAGKSTLCNLLMNGDTLPRKVTATQLAPVWMTKGAGDHMRVQTNGSEEPIALDQLAAVPLTDTSYIRLCLPQEIFDFCDLIDFPGISDPNMDPSVWSNLLGEADAVIWLTHATQAWRQTEAAVWDLVPEEVQERSLLLLTRWDKVPSQMDRTRIIRRLERETMGLFRTILPVSLTDAIAAGDDIDAWTNSGAEALMANLTEIITDLQDTGPAATDAEEDASFADRAEADPSFAAPEPEPKTASVVQFSDLGPASAPADAPKIVPRRVRPTVKGRRERPTATETA